MSELSALFQRMMTVIVRDAQRVAEMPAEEQEAALVAVEASHYEDRLEEGLSPEDAHTLAQSSARWTRGAVELIRQQGSLRPRVLH